VIPNVNAIYNRFSLLSSVSNIIIKVLSYTSSRHAGICIISEDNDVYTCILLLKTKEHGHELHVYFLPFHVAIWIENAHYFFLTFHVLNHQTIFLLGYLASRYANIDEMINVLLHNWYRIGTGGKIYMIKTHVWHVLHKDDSLNNLRPNKSSINVPFWEKVLGNIVQWTA